MWCFERSVAISAQDEKYALMVIFRRGSDPNYAPPTSQTYAFLFDTRIGIRFSEVIVHRWSLTVTLKHASWAALCE